MAEQETVPEDMKPLFVGAAQYADELRERFEGTPTLDQLTAAFSETGRPFRDRPATIVFRDGDPIGDRQLAFTRPDPETDRATHVVYVRESLAEAPGVLLHVLAHELCHVAFGTWVGESDADQFGARLLGLDYEAFRQPIRDYDLG